MLAGSVDCFSIPGRILIQSMYALTNEYSECECLVLLVVVVVVRVFDSKWLHHTNHLLESSGFSLHLVPLHFNLALGEQIWRVFVFFFVVVGAERKITITDYIVVMKAAPFVTVNC